MKEKIFEFLKEIDSDFPTPLSHKVDLAEYAKKLVEKATLCIIEENNQIVSLVVGYTKNTDNGIGYISVVGTLRRFRGKGCGARLMKEFIEKCRQNNLLGVHLYTAQENFSAIRLYKKLGFVDYVIENEPRPNDCHLVYWIDKENK